LAGRQLEDRRRRPGQPVGTLRPKRGPLGREGPGQGEAREAPGIGRDLDEAAGGILGPGREGSSTGSEEKIGTHLFHSITVPSYDRLPACRPSDRLEACPTCGYFSIHV